MNTKAYSIARQNKDKNFDGKFYFAVSTTGIFCRPSCPSPTAKEENVSYFLTIYDAMNNGYRPCLRCRPDIYTEFYTPNINGVAIIEKGMELILKGYLNQHKVSDLAKKLHVSEGHLRKLFIMHMGSSPIKIAKYNRAIFAKRMLIHSNLSITDIAFASGFGSIRQFNNVFSELFKITPSEMRVSTKSVMGTGTTIFIPYEKPFNFSELLKFMRLRMIKGIEIVSEESYSRTFNINGVKGYFRVRDNPKKLALEMDVICEDLTIYREIYYRVRKMFDLDINQEKIKSFLKKDSFMKEIIANKELPRLPVAFDSYEFLIRAILGQQITVKAATTLATRIVEKADIKFNSGVEGLGYVFPSISELMNISIDDLGITKTRVKTINAVNKALINDEFTLSSNQSYEEFVKNFIRVKGIGDWSTNYVAMRGLGMVDAFPASDLGVIKAIKKIRPNIRKKEIVLLAESWRPYRAYATLYLWQSLEEE